MSSADTAPLQTVPARPGSTPGDPGPATGTPDLSPQPHAVLARGHTPDIHQGEPHSISAEDCTSSLSQCPLFTMHVDILYTNCLYEFHLLFHNEHECHYCAYLSPCRSQIRYRHALFASSFFLRFLGLPQGYCSNLTIVWLKLSLGSYDFPSLAMTLR